MIRKFFISLLVALAFAPAAFGQITVDDSLADFYNQPELATGGSADVVGVEELKTCPLGSVGCWIFSRSSAGKLNLAADQAASALVLGLVDTALQFSAIIAVVMLVAAGFRYVAARGESDGTDAAKKHIIWTLAGLIVIMLSLFIVKNVTDLVFRAANVSDENAAKIESANEAADQTLQADPAGGAQSESNSRAILQQQDADWGSGTGYEINIGDGAASPAKTGEVYGVHAGTQPSPSQPGAQPVPAGQSPVVRPESGAGANLGGAANPNPGSTSSGSNSTNTSPSSGSNPNPASAGTANPSVNNSNPAGSNPAAGGTSSGGGSLADSIGGALAGGPGSANLAGSGSSTSSAAGAATGSASSSLVGSGSGQSGSTAANSTGSSSNSTGSATGSSNSNSASSGAIPAPARGAPIAGLGATSGDSATGWLLNSNQINPAGGSYGSAPQQEIISNKNNWDSYGAAAARAAEANRPKLTAAQNGTSRNPGYSFVPPMTESAAVYSQRIGQQTQIEPFRDFQDLGRISADSPGEQGFTGGSDAGSNSNAGNSGSGAGSGNAGQAGSGSGSGNAGSGNGSNAGSGSGSSSGSNSNSQNPGQNSGAGNAGGLIPGSPEWQAYLLANSVSTGPGGAIAFDYGEAVRLGLAGAGSDFGSVSNANFAGSGAAGADLFARLGIGAGAAGFGSDSENFGQAGAGFGSDSGSDRAGSGSDSNLNANLTGSNLQSSGPGAGIASGWDSAHLPPELSQQGPAALLGLAGLASLAAAWFARRRFSSV